MSAAPARLPDTLEDILARAKRHALAGRDEDAKTAYLEVLRRDPAHAAALDGLGHLAYAGGQHSAARTIYRQMVRCHPRNPAGQINLGNILYEAGDLAAARTAFEAALAIHSGLAEAHRGLARVLSDLGDAGAADRHWRRSFCGQAVVPQQYRGREPAVPVLLLVSVKGGNIPTRPILDDRRFAVTALYVEYYDPDLPLPPHALLFNAIGDADLCSDALIGAERIVARTDAPIVNRPSNVRSTGRASNAARLGSVPHVRSPRIRSLPRAALAKAGGLPFPLLLRAPGFHTGQHFVRLESDDEIEAAVAGLPGEQLLAIEYLDARGADGMARKYRVMVIDGSLYPLHLAISHDWKVHYFTANMAASILHRQEENRFLEDMPSVLGAAAMSALGRIGQVLGLDYAGIDFALDQDGSVLLFEANATMVIIPPPPEPMWDYRRAPIRRALDAAQNLLLRKLRLRQPD